MRISDWGSDVCSSDLGAVAHQSGECNLRALMGDGDAERIGQCAPDGFERNTGRPIAARQIGMGCVNVRSEERRVGKSVSIRVDLGGRRIIKKKKESI